MQLPKFFPGDRVRKRGLGYVGTVNRTGSLGWVTIDWDQDGPRICSPKEIEMAEQEGGA